MIPVSHLTERVQMLESVLKARHRTPDTRRHGVRARGTVGPDSRNMLAAVNACRVSAPPASGPLTQVAGLTAAWGRAGRGWQIRQFRQARLRTLW